MIEYDEDLHENALAGGKAFIFMLESAIVIGLVMTLAATWGAVEIVRAFH